MLEGKCKLRKVPNDNLGIQIPAAMAADSQFGWKHGDKLFLEFDSAADMLFVTRIKPKKSHSTSSEEEKSETTDTTEATETTELNKENEPNGKV